MCSKKVFLTYFNNSNIYFNTLFKTLYLDKISIDIIRKKLCESHIKLVETIYILTNKTKFVSHISQKLMTKIVSDS